VALIVIGADTHKRTHALAAIEDATGRLVSEREILADEDGHRDALRWAQRLAEGVEVVWAIEDCRHVSGRLERALALAGERVVRVPPRLMGQTRRGEREIGKSDQIDARAIARAVIREGLDRFAPAFLDEAAMDVRLLTDHRADLVNERTRLTNRLRWHLVILCPELEATTPTRQLDDARQLDRIARRLRALPRSARVRIALEHVARIRTLSREAAAIKRELHELVATQRPELLAEKGCGPITAAILIGHTAGAERFRTDACFARHAGVAPGPGILRAAGPSPPRPRRRPATQPRAARHRDHPRPPGPRHRHLPRPKAS
jgi:transposase